MTPTSSTSKTATAMRLLRAIACHVAPGARAARRAIGATLGMAWAVVLVPFRAALAVASAARAVAGAAASSARSIATEWGLFLRGPSYGPYRRQSMAAGGVQALSGPGLALPLLLILGVSPALTTLMLTSLIAGPAMQLAMPTLLRAWGGHFRAITTALTAVGETVGLWVAPALLGVAVLGWPPAVAAAAVSAALFVNGFASGTAYSNMGVWFHIVLPERERRFVAPRTAGLSAGVAALVLLPVALALDALVSGARGALPSIPDAGLIPFALMYAAGGLCGLAEVAAVRGFLDPGRVHQGKEARSPAGSSELSRFLRVAGLAAFGSGIAPYMSIYAMTVLHASAGFAVSLSAASMGAGIAASTVAAAVLAHRSSSRALRVSYIALGAGYALALGANPLVADALLVLAGANILVAAGAAVGRLAVNERLFRLIGDSDAMSASARFIGTTATGATAGSVVMAGAIAVAPPAFAVYGVLFALSGLARLWTAFGMDVSPSWNSAVNERFARRAEYLSGRDC